MAEESPLIPVPTLPPCLIKPSSFTHLLLLYVHLAILHILLQCPKFDLVHKNELFLLSIAPSSSFRFLAECPSCHS